VILLINVDLAIVKFLEAGPLPPKKELRINSHHSEVIVDFSSTGLA